MQNGGDEFGACSSWACCRSRCRMPLAGVLRAGSGYLREVRACSFLRNENRTLLCVVRSQKICFGLTLWHRGAEASFDRHSPHLPHLKHPQNRTPFLGFGDGSLLRIVRNGGTVQYCETVEPFGLEKQENCRCSWCDFIQCQSWKN
jgi:hypothetical protein